MGKKALWLPIKCCKVRSDREGAPSREKTAAEGSSALEIRLLWSLDWQKAKDQQLAACDRARCWQGLAIKISRAMWDRGDPRSFDLGRQNDGKLKCGLLMREGSSCRQRQKQIGQQARQQGFSQMRTQAKDGLVSLAVAISTCKGLPDIEPNWLKVINMNQRKDNPDRSYSIGLMENFIVLPLLKGGVFQNHPSLGKKHQGQQGTTSSISLFFTNMNEVPEWDYGLILHEHDNIDILRSPFFDVGFDFDNTIEEYFERIHITLVDTIDDQRKKGQWTLFGRATTASPPATSTFKDYSLLNSFPIDSLNGGINLIHGYIPNALMKIVTLLQFKELK
ncbi:hypothetical protein IEQ34_009883 [Dendrobium chrysotoxum]|uniref:Uncharacterized protein n=1 Tax=Dendrobium chrysotoxum TaxID=161865 RepID=A0AAV7H457_DENCH|nr:hypothetical protein IEQ34_009883 [Dendrobium chrysotoxum]